MNLDELVFGHLPLEHILQWKEGVGAGILVQAKLEGVIDDFLKNHKPPTNSSEETLREIQHIENLLKNVDDVDVQFCKEMEENHFLFFEKFCKSLGLDGETETGFSDVVAPYLGILFWLKMKFNRPRPHQLAWYLKKPIFPIVLSDASSPAYPAGHNLDFLIIIHYLKNKYPNHSTSFDKLYERIKYVREISGVHYPSDRVGSETLFQLLLNSGLIR
jgi:hypothetical protein